MFLDTNVLAAGIAGTGLCADLLDYVKQVHEAVCCEQVHQELPKALKKMRLEPFIIEIACEEMRRSCLTVPTPTRPPKQSRDPKDDAILQAALDADCGWLVSGDKDLTSLKRVQRMPITTPRDFLEALGVVDPY